MLKIKKLKHLFLLAVVLQCTAGQTHAASRSSNFNTRANIVASCRVSATAMNFGTRSTVLGTEASSSTLTVLCNNLTPYNVSLRSGSALIARNVNLTNPAGKIIRVRLTLGATGGVSGGAHTLNGLLFAIANPPVGLYQRTQTIFVNY